MIKRWRMWRSSQQFKKAQREAARIGGILCGTVLKDGTPVYFVTPANTSEDAVAERAFEARHGRPRYPIERQLEQWVKETS